MISIDCHHLTASKTSATLTIADYNRSVAFTGCCVRKLYDALEMYVLQRVGSKRIGLINVDIRYCQRYWKLL